MIHALHGNLGSPGDWEEPGQEWREFDAVDLWSWQESPAGLSLREFGERFADTVAAAADAEPVLVGYSLGGRLALHALAARPDLWRAVVLVSTHPGLESESERATRTRSDREWAERAREEEWESFLRDWNGQPILENQAPSPDQVALADRREAVARAFEHWSLGSQLPMDRELEGIATPILLVHGGDDRRFGALAHRMMRHIPTAQVREIPGAGHRLVTERPRELGRSIREWLEDPPSPGLAES